MLDFLDEKYQWNKKSKNFGWGWKVTGEYNHID